MRCIGLLRALLKEYSTCWLSSDAFSGAAQTPKRRSFCSFVRQAAVKAGRPEKSSTFVTIVSLIVSFPLMMMARMFPMPMLVKQAALFWKTWGTLRRVPLAVQEADCNVFCFFLSFNNFASMMITQKMALIFCYKDMAKCFIDAL